MKDKEYDEVYTQIRQRLKNAAKSLNAGIAMTLITEEIGRILAEQELRIRALESTGMDAMIKHNPQLANV